jgi:hypothetical protein
MGGAYREDSNKCASPATTAPVVGADIDGALFKEDWEYASIVGMMMYLASNTRADIAYDVHQSARYSHGTWESHAVKRILRYLKGTSYKGIIFKPEKRNIINYGS